ncbi:unnamed protein product [Closterium sp. NIES-65]|nr:unnamed protein product [Closterium sp. NIES-65]
MPIRLMAASLLAPVSSRLVVSCRTPCRASVANAAEWGRRELNTRRRLVFCSAQPPASNAENDKDKNDKSQEQQPYPEPIAPPPAASFAASPEGRDAIMAELDRALSGEESKALWADLESAALRVSRARASYEEMEKKEKELLALKAELEAAALMEAELAQADAQVSGKYQSRRKREPGGPAWSRMAPLHPSTLSPTLLAKPSPQPHCLALLRFQYLLSVSLHVRLIVEKLEAEVAAAEQAARAAGAALIEARAGGGFRTSSAGSGEQTAGKWAVSTGTIDDDKERVESAKAATVAAVAGTVAGLPFLLSQRIQEGGTGLSFLVAAAALAATCALFGVTYRYIVRKDMGNIHLKAGAVGAFGLARGLAQVDSTFSLVSAGSANNGLSDDVMGSMTDGALVPVALSLLEAGEGVLHASPHQQHRGSGLPGDKDELSRNFPVDDIVQHPLPGYVSPSAIAFSPDDQMISYLFSEEGTLTRKLFAYELKTGQQRLLVAPPGGGVDEDNLSMEEKLRRERQRERGLGITRYDWSKNVAVPRIMIPLPDGVYVQDGMGADLRLRIPGGASPILDPQISPDGSAIAFVRDDELFVVSTTAGAPRQLTFGAKEAHKVHGLAEYIAQEEMERRSGFWWAHDSTRIAFTQTDASAVPLFRIPHCTRPPVGADSEEEHAYPFAATSFHLSPFFCCVRHFNRPRPFVLPFPGQANVSVRLGVVPVAGGEVRWMDLHCGLAGSSFGKTKSSSRSGGINSSSGVRNAGAGNDGNGGNDGGNGVGDGDGVRIGGGTGQVVAQDSGVFQQGEAARTVGSTHEGDAGNLPGRDAGEPALPEKEASAIATAGSSGSGNGTAAAAAAATAAVDDDDDDEEYLARVSWLPDGRLSAQVQNRRQTRLKLLRFDPTTGSRDLVLTETNPLWVNLHDCFTPLVKSGGELRGGFLWASERTGFRHLYLYAGSGRCVGAVTAGEWMVEQVAGLDEGAGLVYFTGTMDSALESHLYVTSLFGGVEGAGGGAGLGPALGADKRDAFSRYEQQQQQQQQQMVPMVLDSVQPTATSSPSSTGAAAGVASPGLPGSNPSAPPPAPPAAATALHAPSSSLAPTAPSSLPPARPIRLTQGPGRHLVVLDHSLQRFVDLVDSLDSPPAVRLCCLASGRVLAVIFQQHSPNPRVQRLQLRPPELVEVTAADGTTLHGAIYRPDPAIFGPPPYRTVVSVYGGPHVQTVCESWLSTVDMRAQFLRARGMLVWKLDNRGSSRRGLAFEGAIKCNMGGIDADDQAAGVRWLIQQGLADPNRIGIYGWSYGGYLSAMCLARYPSLFRCAISGAPVTKWDGYDTHYTERYMGLPAEQPTAYDRSSVMRHVGGIRGKLLLVHGMIDENVHFRHSVRLVQALTTAAKQYELLLFPEERHMPRGLRDRTYMEERIYEFLTRCLS